MNGQTEDHDIPCDAWLADLVGPGGRNWTLDMDEVRDLGRAIIRLRAEVAQLQDARAERDACHGLYAEILRLCGHDREQGHPGVVDAVRGVLAERDKLQAFKTWVHQYLDAQAVPHHPPGTHGAAGCRIGDRMDWLIERLHRAVEHGTEEETLHWDAVAKCDRLEAEVKRLQAVIDTPAKMVFADGREPTENERHLWNLLTWREADLAKQKEQTEYFKRRCDEAGAKLDQAEAERTALARLTAWQAKYTESRVSWVRTASGYLIVSLRDRCDEDIAGTRWVQAWDRKPSRWPPFAPSDPIVFVGTDERPATLDECIVAALDLWDAQEPEVPS